jgi:phenylalanine-4-hydroxylase
MSKRPTAPTHQQLNLRGNYDRARDDYTVEQQWSGYSEEDHAIWALLYRRQSELLPRYAAPQVVAGLATLRASPERIPDFAQTNVLLQAATGWQIVAVPGLIPEQHFFAHLAHRRFPVTVWIRRRDELDYLAEPDVFHDFFGHVALLADPVFARFMQAYGAAGTKALREDGLKMLARLYWYTVEFGLITTEQGTRAYGAGILSSKTETIYSIDSDVPNRIAFDLTRVMRTDYLIDDFQQTYFVLENFEQLFHAGYDTDFAPLYRQYHDEAGLAPQTVLPTDRVINRGSVGSL